MSALFRRFVREDEGQDLAEYALLLGLIAVVCFGAIQTVGTNINTLLNNAGTQLAAS